MFLSGLNSIDFRGLGFMNGDMSPDDLYSTFRNALPQFTPATFVPPALASGVSDSEIHQVIDAVTSKYEVRRLPSNPGFSESITAFVTPIVKGVVNDNLRALRYKSTILGVLTQMSSNGLYLVPIGTPASAPVKSELVDPNNIAAAGVLVVGRTGSPASPAGPASPAPQISAAPGSLTDTIQSGIKQIMAAWPKRAPAGPTQYIRAPHTQTAAEKQRLTLIIGGFGLMFVLAIGVIAARNND